jgi:hypothetical protein
MTAISHELLTGAVVRFERMTFDERIRLADDVYEQQPNLLASVLILHRYGATFEKIEVVLNLPLVFHEAMKGSGMRWPVISNDMQDRCLQRVTARARFIEG